MGKVIGKLIEVDFGSTKRNKDPVVFVTTLKRPKVYHHNRDCNHGLSSSSLIIDIRLSELIDMYDKDCRNVVRACKFCLNER